MLCFSFILLVCSVYSNDDDDVYKPRRMEKPKDDGTWKKKSVLDYSDADVEKLFDQWEVSLIRTFGFTRVLPPLVNSKVFYPF